MIKFLIRIYLGGFSNADRAKVVEWITEEHYRMCRVINAANAKKKAP